MTHQQLQTAKKVTYVVLVLLLGVGIFWLSSGGTFFQSSVIQTENVESGSPEVMVTSGYAPVMSTDTTSDILPIDKGIADEVSSLIVEDTSVDSIETTPADSSIVSSTIETEIVDAAATFRDELSVEADYSGLYRDTFSGEVAEEVIATPVTGEVAGGSQLQNGITKKKAPVPDSGPTEVALLMLAAGIALLIHVRKMEKE